MRTRLILLSYFISIMASAPAFAWGPEGHQEVGAIADRLLTDNARAKLKAIVGFTLEQSGPWLDCVKSVRNNGGGNFALFDDPQHRGYLHPQCEPFFVNAPVEQGRMEDYVRRNWDTCRADSSIEIAADKNCSDVYDYTDVSIGHDEYRLGYAGTSKFDVVSAINAAIHKLRDPTSATEISIADEKEAVLMLAHLVGDLHQPLHVGAIYLDKNGQQLDPDTGTYDKITQTQGGNLLEHLRMDGRHRSFHSEWDSLPTDEKIAIDQEDFLAAKAIMESDIANNPVPFFFFSRSSLPRPEATHTVLG